MRAFSCPEDGVAARRCLLILPLLVFSASPRVFGLSLGFGRALVRLRDGIRAHVPALRLLCPAQMPVSRLKSRKRPSTGCPRDVAFLEMKSPGTDDAPVRHGRPPKIESEVAVRMVVLQVKSLLLVTVTNLFVEGYRVPIWSLFVLKRYSEDCQ
jgi:hypothetical protein